nr:MAG TPA: hypothetical protein [Caudoviricetes sp.]
MFGVRFQPLLISCIRCFAKDLYILFEFGNCTEQAVALFLQISVGISIYRVRTNGGAVIIAKAITGVITGSLTGVVAALVLTIYDTINFILRVNTAGTERTSEKNNKQGNGKSFHGQTPIFLSVKELEEAVKLLLGHGFNKTEGFTLLGRQAGRVSGGGSIVIKNQLCRIYFQNFRQTFKSCASYISNVSAFPATYGAFADTYGFGNVELS